MNTLQDRAISSAAAEKKDLFLLVGNPTSQTGKAAARIQKARDMLSAKGIEHEFRSTLPGGLTVQMVSDSITEDGFRKFIYLGGDGTFNEVAKGICQSGMASEVVIGMLPSGTANDQGKSYGLSSSPKALERNIDIIAQGFTTALDIGEVTAYSDSKIALRRDLFFDSMGWGLSAAALALRNKDREAIKHVPVIREMYRDQAVYARAIAHELALRWVTRDRFTAEVVVDGVTHTFDGLTDLLVSNTIVYAGDWIIDHDAKSDDGIFEVAPFAGVGDWASKGIIKHKKFPIKTDVLERLSKPNIPEWIEKSSVLDRLGARDLRLPPFRLPVLKGSKIEVQIFRPNKDQRLPAQLDGEEFPQSDHIEIQVHPKFLTLIVPYDFHWI